ncbi:MAG: hypothetical protein H7Y11_11535, partial [Armatimonadetes bacterium]|nr:hypothetical protein [Anaerolineae bacterium]
VIRAPQAIRRSENDTSILPWLWDVAAARRERGSRLPDRASAQPFFDNRGGVVLGPNDTLLESVAERYQVVKFDQSAFTLTTEVVTGRNELDPLRVWRSMAGDGLYIQQESGGGVVQINTQTGTQLDLQIGQPLSLGRLDALDGIVFGRSARVIGAPNSTEQNALLAYLLGEDYRANNDYHPLTVTLIDILRPVTFRPDSFAFIVHVYDETDDSGELRVILPDVLQLALSPDETQLLMRRVENNQRLELYDLTTGVLVRTYAPVTRDLGLVHVLDFDRTGTVIISDFQRIDVATGRTLNQNNDFIGGFDNFYFSNDSQQLLTNRGSEWFTWDIATKQLLNRAEVSINGDVLRVWRNGERYLSQLPDQNSIEVYTLATGERRRVVFESVPDRFIQDILPSPDWEHYFLVYSERQNDSSRPGIAVAMYSLDTGKQWLIADGDVPQYPENYGWVDNQTVYIVGALNIPSLRVYGVVYHGSGLPECLVTRFPDDYPRWLDSWERLTAYASSYALHTLAASICVILEEDGSEVSTIDALFTPTAVPTEAYYTPTPALVAGVPTCLTLNFPNQALDYAADWRAITEGLNADQIRDLETLLCENLSGSDSQPRGFDSYVSPVLTIDVATGVRAIGRYIPNIQSFERSAQPLFDAYTRLTNTSLNSPKLSLDGRYIAEFTFDNQVTIRQVGAPYEAFTDDVTATAQAAIEDDNLIRVLPTATAPFQVVGTAGATLTPTITFTPPPSPAAFIAQAQRAETQLFCEQTTLYTLDNLPPDWNPAGRLIVPPLRESDFGRYIIQPTSTPVQPTVAAPAFTALPEGTATITPSRTPRPEDLIPTATPTLDVSRMRTIPERYSLALWVMSPMDGALTIDETLPLCNVALNCNFSFNRAWVWYDDGQGVYLVRPDGSDQLTLVDYSTNPVNTYGDYNWTGADTLEYSVAIYERDPEFPNTYTQRLDPNSSAPTPIPTVIAPSFSINQLYTEVISVQPGSHTLAVARTVYSTGSGQAY